MQQMLQQNRSIYAAEIACVSSADAANKNNGELFQYLKKCVRCSNTPSYAALMLQHKRSMDCAAAK
jgi:hypothetical protein